VKPDCPWFEGRRAEWPEPETLPEKAEVVVIGAGLTGVAVALFLAEGGAHPLVLEARADVGRGASGCCPGLVFPATTEPPIRLLRAMGLERARQLYAFSRENRALLEERVDVAKGGSLWIAADGREEEELEESLDALEQVGVAADWWREEEVTEALGTPEPGPALRFPDDVLVDPADTVARLADQAVTAGVRIQTRCPVQGVEVEDRGVVVHQGARRLVTEAVVFATNAWSPSVHHFFEAKITPYREQALATEPVPTRLSFGMRAQRGYFTWRQTGSGQVLMRGARWAARDMALGETGEAPTEPVQGRIEHFLHATHPSLEETAITHRWAWIEAMSCDGLPIIGPMPGSFRMLCCAGFNGNQLGLGMRAARAVADGLLTGRARGVPAYMDAGRFW
jgi:glycine/D-amino acid oxidase-like deaminating enzyme